MKKILPLMQADADQGSAPNVPVNGSNPEAAPVIYTGGQTLASATEDADTLMQSFISGDAKFFSTIQVAADATPEQRRETQVRMFNAISDAGQLSDHVNEPLCVTDYMAHPVILNDNETGEITPAIRVLLVTSEGISYAAVSKGIMSSIERLRAIVGAAPWHPGIWMKATAKKVNSSSVNKVLSLSLLTAAEVAKLPKK